MACARALLPPPFNWESYTYTASSGQSWTRDVVCTRSLAASHPASKRLVLDAADVVRLL